MLQHLKRQGGQQLVLMAVLLPVLLIFAGLVVDAGRAYTVQRRVQSAADSAAMAAATVLADQGLAAAQQVAYSYASTNGYTKWLGSGPRPVNVLSDVKADYPWTGAYATDANRTHYIQVEVMGAVKPIFAAAVWSGNFQIKGRATAGYVTGGAPNSSFIVLSKEAKPGLDMSGGSKLDVYKGNFHVNATGSTALNMNNGAKISTEAGYPGTVNGGMTVTNGTKRDPEVVANTGKVLEDPLKDVEQPVPSNFTVRSSSKLYLVVAQSNNWGANAIDLLPGVYVGGIDASQGVKVTMEPGVYIMKGGSFTASNGVKVNGSEVMLFFTKNTSATDYGTLLLSGGVKVSLTPMSTATATSLGHPKWAGIVVFQDRSTSPSPNYANGTHMGDSDSPVKGIIYMPGANVSFAGGNHTVAANLIVYTLNMSNGCWLKVEGYRGDGWNGTTTVAQVE